MSDDPNSASRFRDLEARLKEGRKKAGLEPEPARISAADSRAAGRALHASIEFVVSICVGTALGYGIGLLLEARVIGLVAGMALGFAAGLRGMFRLMQEAGAEEEERDGHGRDTD